MHSICRHTTAQELYGCIMSYPIELHQRDFDSYQLVRGEGELFLDIQSCQSLATDIAMISCQAQKSNLKKRIPGFAAQRYLESCVL